MDKNIDYDEHIYKLTQDVICNDGKITLKKGTYVYLLRTGECEDNDLIVIHTNINGKFEQLYFFKDKKEYLIPDYLEYNKDCQNIETQLYDNGLTETKINCSYFLSEIVAGTLFGIGKVFSILMCNIIGLSIGGLGLLGFLIGRHFLTKNKAYCIPSKKILKALTKLNKDLTKENISVKSENKTDAFEDNKPVSMGEVLRADKKEQLMMGVWEQYPMGLELYRSIPNNITDITKNDPNNPLNKKGA